MNKWIAWKSLSRTWLFSFLNCRFTGNIMGSHLRRCNFRPWFELPLTIGANHSVRLFRHRIYLTRGSSWGQCRNGDHCGLTWNTRALQNRFHGEIWNSLNESSSKFWVLQSETFQYQYMPNTPISYLVVVCCLIQEMV